MKAKNFTHIMRFILPLIALSLFLESCSQDDVFNEPDNINTEIPRGKKVGDLIINEASLILDAASIDQIKSICEDLIVFESEPTQADEIKAGTILVGAKYDGSNLQNIMGKVTDINTINGEWHISITPVAIEEFIYSGSISGTIYPTLYSENSLRNGEAIPNIIIQDINGFPSYALSSTRATIRLPRIEHSGTYNIPEILPIVDLQSNVSLTAGFTPVFDYTIKFGWTGIKEFNIKVYAQEILLDAHLNAYAGLKFDLSLADMYSIPVIPIALGPTGLIISPTVSAGPYINVQAGTSMNVKLFHAEGEISYILTNPTQKPSFDLVVDPYNWSNVNWGGAQAKAEGGLHLSAGFSLTFIATNLASVGASSKIGIGSTIGMNDLSKVNLNIYGRINADARILLGTPPLQYEKSFPVITWNPTIFAKDFNTGIQ